MYTHARTHTLLWSTFCLVLVCLFVCLFYSLIYFVCVCVCFRLIVTFRISICLHSLARCGDVKQALFHLKHWNFISTLAFFVRVSVCFFGAHSLGIVSSNLTAFAHITHSIGDGIKFQSANVLHALNRYGTQTHAHKVKPRE